MVQKEIRVTLVRQVHGVSKVKLVHRAQKAIKVTLSPMKILHHSSS